MHLYMHMYMCMYGYIHACMHGMYVCMHARMYVLRRRISDGDSAQPLDASPRKHLEGPVGGLGDACQAMITQGPGLVSIGVTFWPKGC